MPRRGSIPGSDLPRKKAQWNYEKWWKGKIVQSPYTGEVWGRVVAIEVSGPPSFVYGDCFVTIESETQQRLVHSTAYKPRKRDLIVVEEPHE